MLRIWHLNILESKRNEAIYIRLAISRMQHCRGVAEKMKEMTENNPEKYPYDPEEMYVLGLLHDVGYGLCACGPEHPEVGANALKRSGYKYWKEVLYHSRPNTPYKSPALELLNYCDLTVGPNGEDMTVPERVGDISVRYGQGSSQVENALQMIDELKKLGYKVM